MTKLFSTGLLLLSLLLLTAFRGAGAGRNKTVPPDPGTRTILWEDGVKNAYPRWSRSGERILYQSNRGGRWRLFVMDRDGTHRKPVTDGTSNDSFPDWSPDNESIAFVSDRQGNEDVYVMNADGSRVRNLSASPARDIHPYWAPDGTRILFNSTRDTGRLQIFEVTVRTGEIRRLVESPDDDSCARISPKGDRIVYLANLVAGHDDIIVRNRDGSAPVNITHDAAPDGWPAWTPAGDRIVYASAGSGRFALGVMRPDGSGRRQISFPPSGESDARPNVSADGKRIVFNRDRGETIGILTMDLP